MRSFILSVQHLIRATDTIKMPREIIIDNNFSLDSIFEEFEKSNYSNALDEKTSSFVKMEIRKIVETIIMKDEEKANQGSMNISMILLFLTVLILGTYSSLPNKHTGQNKRTGWNFDKNQISVQGGILIKILEYRVKTGYFIDNKKDF